MQNYNQKNEISVMRESDLTLEVAILLILGVFMSIFGLLLFRINTGELPYNPDSMYGLFLVLISIQIITLGKTPLADLRRSWALIIIGISSAILGMVACFIPGILTEFVRILAGIILLIGGISLFLQLFVLEDKAKLWMKTSGILRQLTIICAIIYILTVILGIITLFPGITTNPITAVLLIVYGISFLYLSWCIQKTAKLYPSENESVELDKTISKGFSIFREVSLPLSITMLITMAVLLTVLALMLFPVFLGLLPFSPDGQLGLLLVLMAIRIMTLGDTPMGQFKRSWLMVIFGLVFAALGIVSSIVPGILTGIINILLGILNIIGGSVLLIQILLPILSGIRNPPAEPVVTHPILKKLLIIQIILNLVTIAFGLSMLMPGLIPGILVAVILFINGIILFVLAYMLQKVDQIEMNVKQSENAQPI